MMLKITNSDEQKQYLFASTKRECMDETHRAEPQKTQNLTLLVVFHIYKLN